MADDRGGSAMLISAESLALMDEVARRLRREAARRAIEVARADGRTLVTEDDVREAVDQFAIGLADWLMGATWLDREADRPPGGG